RGPSQTLAWIPAFAGMNGVRGRRLRSAARSTAAQMHSRTGISQPRDVSSTNGKPPGGDPAAPVRRRSCRGAGRATAGARLGMWCLQALSARVFHVHRAPIGAMRTPVVRSIALASAEPAPVRSGQAIEYRKAPFLILVKALVQRICGVGQ